MLRKAHLTELTPAEVHALFALRCEVFIVEQQSPYLDVDDVDIAPGTWQVLATDDDGRLVGTARVFLHSPEGEDPTHIVMSCRPSHRGTGLGRQLMTMCVELCGERPVEIEAQAALAEYYGQWGFEVTGEPFDDAGVLHVPMRRG